MKSALNVLLFLSMLAQPASALDGPWVSDVFFYWYTWDSEEKLGSWIGGIYNTPLAGYYDSRTFRDNRRSLWQASEWGITHHFMDYWTPNWKGENDQMREAVVMRAAESLRKEGYDIWMAYYQDGTNFEMQEFSRNVSEKRDVHQWLRDFAASEVWPKIDGQPLQLVYSRNGRPKTTLDHEGFRRFLKRRYDDVANLNTAWGTSFKSFDEIDMTFARKGPHRAASVEYQYETWQREWQKLNGLVKKEFGFPGMKASFDVGYGPFMGFGFADFARVFGGPHSYGGIFGPPDDQDAQRFIQAAVAKKYNTVFLDHFKNHYFDWDIRIPGTGYLPDPFHFDRFRVGALARHSEAILHLSWNEWWEGSNLEPCHEFGKTYCEKNLFYTTLMKLAFDSIQSAGRGAPVAVILNDWRFAAGAGFDDELYDTIQILRRLNVPFDLVPDDFVTADTLEHFRLVIAPSFGSGLGYNQKREPILDVLTGWLKGRDRRLIISAHKSVAERFALHEVAPAEAGSTVKGDDLNVFVNVGTEGDDQFLRDGHSGRETWGVPAAKVGDDPKQTFRWTPASGAETSFVLPSSPNRDHVLRVGGRAIWPNTVEVVVNGRKVGTAEIPAGEVQLQLEVPAAMIGNAPMIHLQLRHAQMNVPGEKAPQTYPGEARVCNLGLGFLQWSTANVPDGTRKQRFTIAEDSLRLAGELFGEARSRPIPLPFEARPHLAAPAADVLSALRINSVPRDIGLAFGPSQVLYVNGRLSEVQSDDYWLALLVRWAGVDFPRFAVGEQCMAGRLNAGDTDFVVCFNEDITEPRKLRLSVPNKDVPLSEAYVLSRDGRSYEPLDVATDGTSARTVDTFQYYGVYQFAFSPVKIETPELILQPGRTQTFSIQVTNLTPQPVQGQIQAAAVIPTISGEPVQITLQPNQKQRVPVQIKAAPTTDWGRKTVYFNLVFGDRRAVVLRDLIIQKPVDVELAGVILGADKPQVELHVPQNPYGRTAPLTGAQVTFEGQTLEVPAIEEGGRSTVALPALEGQSPAQPTLVAKTLEIKPGGPGTREAIQREVFVAFKPETYHGPANAVAALVVFNARSEPLEHELLAADVAIGPGPHSVRLEDGTAVPLQIDASGRVVFLADVPGRSARTFYLCRSEAEAPTDLRVRTDGLGSGSGTLVIENSHYSATLSEAAGGTVTGLHSLKTNRDYGRNSFGVNYGTFSRHDPTQPRTDTVQYIHESKTRQEDTPATIELVSQGPAVVVARVRWADEKVRVQQLYEFRAYQPYFVIRQKVQPIDLGGAQELVAFNAQFQPHRLTKSFPNFVGVPAAKEQPHFGWRQGDWVPPYASLIAPGHFDEALSLVIPKSQGLVRIRQGFWPAARPESGKCEIAQIELLADPRSGCDAEIYVLLHPGHQIVAKRFLADLKTAPRIDVVKLKQ